MKTLVLIFGLLFLASCGADGEPIPPKFSGGTTISVNSNSGLSVKNSVGVGFEL